MAGDGVVKVNYVDNTSFVSGDIGRQVTQATTLHTGTLLDFDVDQDGTTLSWAMHDEHDVAMSSVKEVVNNGLTHLVAKTKKMNDILNDDVPYFRCSDDDIVKVYYFHYAVHAMYYTYIGKGQE